MRSSFKIYVPVLDEENLIEYTLEALLKVFLPEQIEVIDLGSTDSTLARIPSSLVVHHVTLPTEEPGRYFTELKDSFSKRQEWVLWVDGDEIYPTSVLRHIKYWLNSSPEEKSMRVYWRILDKRQDGMYCSREYLSAGPKLFNSRYFGFRRAWPKEVIYPLTEEVKAGEKWEFTGVWFWHGVLLDRSNVLQTVRKEKADNKHEKYMKYLTWEKLQSTPWEAGYASLPTREWTVINMSKSKEGTLDTKWSGVL